MASSFKTLVVITWQREGQTQVRILEWPIPFWINRFCYFYSITDFAILLALQHTLSIPNNPTTLGFLFGASTHGISTHIAVVSTFTQHLWVRPLLWPPLWLGTFLFGLSFI